MRKRTQTAASIDRRNRIINVALKLFARRGYENITMEEIRLSSGASVGSLYHRFKSKEQLVEAVYVEGILDFQRSLTGALDEYQTAREGLKLLVSRHLYWVRSNPERAKFMFQFKRSDMSREVENLVNAGNRDFIEEMGAWLEKKIESRELRLQPPEIFVSMILGPSQEYARSWLTKGKTTDLEEIINRLSEAIWLGLRPYTTRRKK